MSENEVQNYLKSLEPDDAEAYSSNLRAYRPGISLEESTRVYDQWTTYEEDLNLERYRGPVIAAETVAQFFPTDREKCLVIDVACGSGFVGQELVKHGFERLHGLDPSFYQLQTARQKNIYEELFHCYLDENRLPIEDDVYDCAVSSGGMGEGHIPTVGLYQLTRIVKPGGLVCIIMREEYLDHVKEYRDRLATAMQEMDTAGVWKLAASVVVPNYFLDKNGIVFTFIVC